MKVGNLRHRIVIQSYTASIATNGETTKSFTTFATVFAEVRPISAREILQNNSDKVQQEISHVATIRFLSGVLAKMRVVWETKTLEVLGVVPDRTNKKMIQLTCKELAS